MIEVINNCPICGNILQLEELSRYRHNGLSQGPCQQFLCYTPLVTNPLHYYSHVAVPTCSPVIQEFSLDLGSKHVLVVNNFVIRRTSIKNNKYADPLELNFLITPDFPDCRLLKKQIRTALTFS